MAQRSVLCIDPETKAVSQIRRAFEPYGFSVESIPNGDQAIEWARTNVPALIVLSVEPRKVGYAICNKLKRSPTLRDIPLILTSSEETMATFEQHRKLKSRAEEYLLKPIDPNELLEKAARFVALGEGESLEEIEDAESGDIEIADDDISEVSAEDEDAEGDARVFGSANSHDTGEEGLGADEAASLRHLGDLSRPARVDSYGSSPFGDPDALGGGDGEPQAAFDAEQFDPETQAAFDALESASADGSPAPLTATGGQLADEGGPSDGSVDLRSLLKDDLDDLGAGGGSGGSSWRRGAGGGAAAASDEREHDDLDAAAAGAERTEIVRASSVMDTGFDIGAAQARLRGAVDDPALGEMTPPPEDPLLGRIGDDVPPLPEDVLYDEHQVAEAAARDQRIAELQTRVDGAEAEKRAVEGRVAELQERITSLEAERQTLRHELDEQRDRMNQVVSQGAFSKERDLLGLREIINNKEKDILDLRDALDAKERQILDHKDKIREHERARRDLEERTLGFEKSLVAANEKVAELIQDRERSAEREKGLKARLDDAHEELRKAQDEFEALRRRLAQTEERARAEVEKVRAELEAKLVEVQEAHREQVAHLNEERADSEAELQAAHQAEIARLDAAHRMEVENLQRRLNEEIASSNERLQSEVGKLRREHEKAIAALKEEQGLQLASERHAYETQTEAKQRAHRDEIMNLRRRHEEELAAAEERRQRDVSAEEQRRLSELEQAESRRRAELQARDEEHHARLTELERRHLVDKTEMSERHRIEHDQAVGRAARAEGELAARAQEIEQAYRRLAGFEADLDAARVELSDREVKLAQARDRIGELESKVADYEDQIVRAYQRLRTDEKSSEKVRRALTVALALLDERSVAPASGPIKLPAPSAAAASSSSEEPAAGGVPLPRIQTEY